MRKINDFHSLKKAPKVRHPPLKQPGGDPAVSFPPARAAGGHQPPSPQASFPPSDSALALLTEFASQANKSSSVTATPVQE